jgi:hypothetical protein
VSGSAAEEDEDGGASGVASGLQLGGFEEATEGQSGSEGSGLNKGSAVQFVRELLHVFVQ